MREFLNRILKFALFLPVAWGVVFLMGFLSPWLSTLFVAKPTLEGAVHLKSREFLSLENDLEYLFLGSSTCYCGIDPSALDGESFSLCSSAQKIGNSREVLDIALNHSAPNYVVIDIYPELWEGDVKSLESTRDWIVNSPFYNGVEADDLFSYLLQFYFEISESLGIHHEPYKAPKSDKYMGLGFVARNKDSLDVNPCVKEKSYSMPDRVAELLLEIGGQSNMILLIPPVLCEINWELPESLKDVHVIDGGLWPESKTPSMYYDDHHLVAEGARQYSDWLAMKLKLYK